MKIINKVRDCLAGLVALLFLGSISLFIGCAEDSQIYYGPVKEMYGPQPACQNDQECIEQYGEGWYCEDSIDWPTCLEE